MTIVTIYALFGDDIRLLIFSKVVDDYFYALSAVSLVLFSIEIILASLAQDHYFLGFYFWLDLVSTISLISDIGWIMDAILGNQSFDATNAQQASQLARASRGAKVGSKAGRIIRIIRLIRLIRIVKLYKHAHQAFDDDEDGLTKKEKKLLKKKKKEEAKQLKKKQKEEEKKRQESNNSEVRETPKKEEIEGQENPGLGEGSKDNTLTAKEPAHPSR